MPTWIRMPLVTAYVVYGVLLFYTVWTPNPTAPGRAVLFTLKVAARLGHPISENLAEFGLNIVLFVPLGLLGVMIFQRTRVGDWVMIGFVITVIIELVQREMLSSRFGDMRDVVANTLGAMSGALAGWILRSVILEWTPPPQRPAGRPFLPQ